ncbi:MAG: IclR family transcriptional regulator [Actinobacteria bacterium]|nr:IclR family transcriptional regulator [Actinomycetota bacterium]
MQKTRPESETGPAYPIASVNNALLLLLLFREQPRVRLTDACKYLGVAHSTAHRLLAMLAHHGFVQQEPDTRAYVAGPALVEVGLAVVGSLNVREQARPVMEELNAELGETVHLGVLEGNQVRYVDAVEPDRALRVVARTGILMPAHCTSLGKSLLAQMTDQQIVELYPTSAEPFPGRTARSITTQAALMEEISGARKRGFAVNSGETEDDVGSVAVAFRDFAGRPAAIAVAAPSSRLNSQRISRIGEMMIDALAKAPEGPRRG